MSAPLPFAVLGHPAGLEHVAAVLGGRLPPRPLLLKLLEWAPPFVMAEFEVRSPLARARGLYITCPFLPETLRSSPFGCLAKVREACRLAEGRGARLVCLGGFTSLAARKGPRHLGLPYLTGSRLTAALTMASCTEAAGLVGLELARATVAVIGGLGEIGRLCASSLAGQVARLILTTRRPQRQRLSAGLTGAELSAGNRAAAARADLVICAAASPQPLLSAGDLRPGTICCDVGYPPNVAGQAPEGVVLFRGGLARPPHPIEFGFDLGLPGEGLTYGCFAEAMVTALEGDPALPEERLLSAFGRHGFAPAGLWWQGRELTGEDFARAALARSQPQGERRL